MRNEPKAPHRIDPCTGRVLLDGYTTQNPERADGIPGNRQKHQQTQPDVGARKHAPQRNVELQFMKLHPRQTGYQIEKQREETRQKDAQRIPEHGPGRGKPDSGHHAEHHGDISAHERRTQIERMQHKAESPQLEQKEDRQKRHEQRKRLHLHIPAGAKPQHAGKKQMQNKDKMSYGVKYLCEHSHEKVPFRPIFTAPRSSPASDSSFLQTIPSYEYKTNYSKKQVLVC